MSKYRTRDQTGGLPMFDHPKARATDPETSHEAAESIPGVAKAQRGEILSVLRASGPQTADSLDYVIGWRVTTAGRRLKELAESGLVEMTAYTSLTRSGRKAFVWRLKSVLAPAPEGP